MPTTTTALLSGCAAVALLPLCLCCVQKPNARAERRRSLPNVPLALFPTKPPERVLPLLLLLSLLPAAANPLG